MKKAFIVSMLIVLLLSMLSVGISIKPGVASAPCPGTPTNPSPADTATDVSIDTDLNWNDCPDAARYQVYFGTDLSSLAYIGNPVDSYWELGTLEEDTTYSWCVWAVNPDSDCFTVGPIWSFHTNSSTPCSVPSTPTNPSPADTATNVPLDYDLDWSDCTNTSSYDVYFGTNPSPTILVGSPSDSFWDLPDTLTSKTTYYWKIVAKNDCSNTPGPIWRFTTECAALCTTFENLLPDNGSSDIPLDSALDWSDCTNASSYDVYFGTNPVPPKNGSTTASNWSPTLSVNTKYYWRVVAKNNCGGCVSTSVWNFTTACPVPGEPNTSVPLTSSHWIPVTTTLDWNDCAYASSYRIYLGNDSLSLKWVGNSTSSSYKPSGLSVNTTYYWQIVANNSCGNTTGPLWDFTTDCAIPSQPANPSPQDRFDNISVNADLSWDNCSNASSYDIYFNTGSPPTTRIAHNISANSYALPTLSPNTTHYWKVVAKNSCGDYTNGSIWRFTTECPAPSAPGSPSPDNGSTGRSIDTDLSWGASSNATSYYVYFDNSSDPTTLLGNTTSRAWTLTPLSYNTTYYWRVVANNSCSNTSGPVWSFTTVSGCATPSKPQAVSPGNGSANISTSVTLNWSVCTNVSSYRIYLDTSPTPAYNNSTTNTSYPVSNLSYSTKYYWQVIANSSCGNTTASDIWSFTTACGGLPTKPQAVSPVNGAVNVSMSATLNWSACTNATSYDVYLGTSETPVFNRSTTNTTYSVSLNYSTRYYWKVVANNSCGINASDIWSFTTLCTVAPSKPQTPSPVNGSVNISTSVTLNWSVCANATSYDVYLGTSETPVFNRSTNNTSYSASLNYSTRYYWKVVANNSCGTNASDVWNFTTAGASVSTPTPTPVPTIALHIGGTSASLNTSSSGIVQQAVNITSADGTINLRIPAGTRAWNSENEPLDELSMSHATQYHAASGDREVIAAFDFEPDGATFVPGIVVTLSYTHGMIPAGVNESNLRVASYNESSKGWEYYNDCVVNASANTITFTVSHFTTFTIQATSESAGLGKWVIITIIFAAAIVLGLAGGLYIKYRRIYGSLYYEDEGDEDDKYDQYREDREDEGDFKF